MRKMNNMETDKGMIDDILYTLKEIQDPYSTHYLDRRDVSYYVQNLVNESAELKKKVETQEKTIHTMESQLQDKIDKETSRLHNELDKMAESFHKISDKFETEIQKLTFMFKAQTNLMETQIARFEDLLSKIRHIVI